MDLIERLDANVEVDPCLASLLPGWHVDHRPQDTRQPYVLWVSKHDNGMHGEPDMRFTYKGIVNFLRTYWIGAAYEFLGEAGPCRRRN
jgi:hypothetical protein